MHLYVCTQTHKNTCIHTNRHGHTEIVIIIDYLWHPISYRCTYSGANFITITHTHTHTRTHAHTHTHTHTFALLHVYPPTHTCTQIHTHTQTHAHNCTRIPQHTCTQHKHNCTHTCVPPTTHRLTHAHAHACAHMSACTQKYACVHARTHVHVCTHTHTTSAWFPHPNTQPCTYKAYAGWYDYWDFLQTIPVSHISFCLLFPFTLPPWYLQLSIGKVVILEQSDSFTGLLLHNNVPTLVLLFCLCVMLSFIDV